MKYTTEQLEKINNSISLVDYASKYLELTQGTGKRNNEYWCVCPFHDGDVNPSLSFNSDKNVFKCMGCNTKGGLINFIMAYHKKTFPQAVEYILQLTNLHLDEIERSETLEYLYKTKRNKHTVTNIKHIYLPDNVMNQYNKEPIKEWIVEGISQEVLNRYDVRYNRKGNSIVFPIKDIEGKIIAIKARTLYINHRELGIPKYIYYNDIITNDFLFGLYQNINNIKIKNECLVVEGAKGVMLAESQGYDNVVSLETSNINEYQINILLSLKTDIVFALDKGIKIDNKVVGLLPKFTNVYVMEDRQGLINNKDCPFDKDKEVSDKLYEGRYLYK